MNQRNIAKPSDTSQLAAQQATLPQRLYKGSIDCGIQVNRSCLLDIEFVFVYLTPPVSLTDRSK